MTEARLRRFTRRWFAEWLPDKPAFGRASDLMTRFINHRPEEAWRRILALVKDAPSDFALSCVAAGSLEDFLCDHGPAFIDEVEAEAVRNERLAACLGNVWGWTRMDESLYARVRKASRPSAFGMSDAELLERQKDVPPHPKLEG